MFSPIAYSIRGDLSVCAYQTKCNTRSFTTNIEEPYILEFLPPQKCCAAGHTDTLHCFALQNLTEHITSSRFATFQNHFFPLPLTSCSLLGCLERNILARDTGIRRTLPLTMRACLIAVAAAFNVPAPMAPAPVAYATPATGYVPVEQTYLRGAVPSDVYLTGGGGWVVAVDRPNVGRSVLGCIETDVCDQIFILQHFSSFTRLARFCTAPSSTFVVLRMISQILVEVC